MQTVVPHEVIYINAYLFLSPVTGTGPNHTDRGLDSDDSKFASSWFILFSQVESPYAGLKKDTSTSDNHGGTSQSTYDEHLAPGQASMSLATPSGDSTPSTGGRWMPKTFGNKWYQPVVNLFFTVGGCNDSSCD